MSKNSNRCKFCGLNKELTPKCCSERNISTEFNRDDVDGYYKMNNLDKLLSRKQFYRKQPEYLQTVHMHCGVPCIEGEINKRFGERIQICLVCGLKTVPLTFTPTELTNSEIEILQKPYLEN